MVLQSRVHLLERLPDPLVHLQLSSPLIRRHGRQGVSSNLLVRLTYRPAVRWSQVPGRVPQISFEVLLGYPSFVDYVWIAGLSRLPDALYPFAVYYNIWCNVCRTNSVAHALLPPLTSPTRVMLRTLDETTDSSDNPAVPQIYRSGKQRRTQHTQTRAGYQCSLARIIQKSLTTLWNDDQQSHSTADQISSSPQIPVSI